MQRTVLALLALFIACNAAAQPAGSTRGDEVLWLRPPTAPALAWRGMLPSEGGAVNSGGAIMYAAVPNLAGALAQVFAHALVSQGAQSLQRKREQEAADGVLLPYMSPLADWTPAALWAAAAGHAAAPASPLPPPAATSPAAPLAESGASAVAVAMAAPTAAAPPPSVGATPVVVPAGPALRLWTPEHAPAGASQIEAEPVFTLAADESTVILDLAVRLTADSGQPPTVVRVVSSPVSGSADMRAHWLADGARALKTLTAAMFAHGVRMARAHAEPPSADAVPMRTHRYLQGGVERSERGQRVGGDCTRAVLRNLRGWLISVPTRPAENCTTPSGGF